MMEPSSELCGVPDPFQRSWTPHRIVYVEGDKPKDETGCPFYLSPTKRDGNGLIVVRGEHASVVMNLFPYSLGHLLVYPYRHVSGYVDAIAGGTREMAEPTQRTITVLMEVSQPVGSNIGMNQGIVVGAGIAVHLYQHVAPRWLGDTNFMPIVG